MREENKSGIIHDALNFLDDEMIEEVDRLRGGVSVENVSTHKVKFPWRKWSTLAASICLLIVLGNAWFMMQNVIFDTGNMNGGNESHDGMMEGDMEDVNQSGSTGVLPDAEEDKYGVQDGVENNDGGQPLFGEPQTSESKTDDEFVNLKNYTVVYFSENKGDNASDDGMVMLSEEECQVLNKFIESMQKGTESWVDVTTGMDAIEKADGHLFFEFEDGTSFHLVLLGDGTVCNYETKYVWLQMDKRVYRILIENLKDNS